jgi:hypothetical protein
VLLSDAQPTRLLCLLLNYDGTLVPLAQSPELAAPHEELLSLLDELARLPGIQIDIVSARTRARRWSPFCPGPADQLGHHHVRPLSIPALQRWRPAIRQTGEKPHARTGVL